MIDWTKIKALTFDCYGTMIDWERGLATVLNAWAFVARITPRDETLLVSFGKHETAVQGESPSMNYVEVLREVLNRMGQEFGVAVAPYWQDRLALSVRRWPPFQDSPEALARLKRRFQLGVLSNVDRISFAHSNDALIVDFDFVVTAQDVGSYKPARANFDRLITVLADRGIARDDFVHVAQSLYHDHAPAKALGLKTVFIDRRGGQAGGATPAAPGASYDETYPSLRALAAAIVPGVEF